MAEIVKSTIVVYDFTIVGIGRSLLLAKFAYRAHIRNTSIRSGQVRLAKR